jgi:hypothetical protein
MFFMELPDSGDLINYGAILRVSHEEIDGCYVARVQFINNATVVYKGKDAIALVENITDKTI